ERAQEREQRIRAEARLQELERLATQPATETPKAESSPAPQAETFPDYETYLDARADFRAEQAFKALQRQDAEQRAQQERSTTQRQRDLQFAERMTKVREAEPEFMNAISEPVKKLKPFDALAKDAQGNWRDPESGQFVRPSHAALAEHIL